MKYRYVLINIDEGASNQRGTQVGQSAIITDTDDHGNGNAQPGDNPYD